MLKKNKIFICSIGECMAEIYNKNQNNFAINFAGDTANTAIYMSRLGLHTSYLTAVGNDNISNKMIKYLDSEKINTQHVYKKKDKTIGMYLIQNDKKGEREFTYWRSDSAAKFFFEKANIKQLIKEFSSHDAIYFSGITLSIYNNKNLNIFYTFLKLLKKNDNLKIFMDLNIRKKNWEKEDKMKKVLKKFLLLVDVVLLSEEDLQNIKHISIEKFQKSYSCKSKEILFRKNNGTILYYSKNTLMNKIKCKLKNKVIDTTGCGDSFNASFIEGYLKNKKFENIIKQSHNLASLVAMHRGAIITR